MNATKNHLPEPEEANGWFARWGPWVLTGILVPFIGFLWAQYHDVQERFAVLRTEMEILKQQDILQKADVTGIKLLEDSRITNLERRLDVHREELNRVNEMLNSHRVQDDQRFHERASPKLRTD